jgi:23S rRNA (uracil1939-C5)-methyltransferase
MEIPCSLPKARSGLGNFTLPIATKAGHVVGIEGDQPLVNHAKENALLNNLSNVEFFAADLSKDVSDQAWARQKYNKVFLAVETE